MGRTKTYSILIVVALASLFWLNPAAAQNFERYRPRPITPAPFTPIIPESAVAPATGSDEVLVSRLDAVVVLDNAKQVNPSDAFANEEGIVRRFQERNSLVYSEAFEAILNRYLGGPITLRNLNQMSRDIILLYRNSDQPVIDVIIPEQKISGGTVQIVVVESRVGEVILEGYRWSDPCYLEKKIHCTESGERLYESSLKHDLFRLNQYPFRRVEVDLEPGQKDGTTDVIFQVNDVFPARGYFGYEDTGVPNLRLERLYVGATFGGLLGADSLTSYQATTDINFSHLNAHSLFYQNPLNDRWSFESYGSWAGVNPIVAVGLNQDGESWQTGFALNRQLTNNEYEQSLLKFGFDFKSTNTNVEFGGARVFNSSAEQVELRLGYQSLRRYDDGDYFRLNNDIFVGPGPQFSPGNTAAAFNTVRAGALPNFIYDRVHLERLWNFQKSWQFVARGTGQVASNRLLWSETLGFGGYDSIRGYNQRTFNADAGWILNMELGPKPFQWGPNYRPEQLRLYSFVDMGDAYVLNSYPGEISQKFLASAGVGLRYSLNQRVSMRLDYGFGFQDVPYNPGGSRQRIHLGIVSLFGPQP